MDVSQQRNLICRTCGSKNQDMMPITSEQSYGVLNVTIYHAIMECASVQVAEGDGLPEQVCSTCIKNLNTAFVFRIRCQEIDSKFRIKAEEVIEELDDSLKIGFDSTQFLPENESNTKIITLALPETSPNLNITLNASDYNYSLENNSEVKVEEATVLIPKVTPYNCKNCNLTYDGFESLQAHLDTKHCSIIEYVKPSEKFVDEPLAATDPLSTDTNSAENRYGVTFTNTTSTSQKQQQPKELFKCDVCEKGFTTKRSMKAHFLMHTGETPYRCDLCGKTFVSGGGLKTHSLLHSAEKPYKCDVCNKDFSRKEVFNTHKLLHTGERPFKCEVCNSGFLSSGNLKQHMLLHTGERPHKCEVCQKGFTKKQGLKLHMAVHTGESYKSYNLMHAKDMPYKCNVCNQGFLQREYLISHKLIHHSRSVS